MSLPIGRVAPPALWSRIGRWWEQVQRIGRRPPKRLRLCESLALGERRFVAVVEFEKARFLLGGTASTMVLLSRLDDFGAGERERPRGEAC